MKKYGDTVTYVRGGVSLNALVAQSSEQADGEHLTVLYLDPAFNSPIMAGASLARAVSTAFASPLKEGQVNGWKEIEAITTLQSNFADESADELNRTHKLQEQVDVLKANAATLQAAVDERQKELEYAIAQLHAKPEPAPNAKTDDEVYESVKAGLLSDGQVVVPDGAFLDQAVAAVNRFLKEQSEQK